MEFILGYQKIQNTYSYQIFKVHESMIHDPLQTKTTVQLVVFLSIQGQMHNYHFFLCNDHFNNNWIPGQMFFLYREGLQQQVWP